MAKKQDFQEQKNAPKAKNHIFIKKISKTMDKIISWGTSAPFLMMPVTLQGIKNTWASKTLFFELLAAQAVGHVYCWVSCLLPGLNPNFFGHQMFPKDLSGILARQLLQKLCTLKKVQLCGLLWWPLCDECPKKTFQVQISCPLITKKRKKWKNSPLNCQKKSPNFQTFFQQWRVFYNPYCNS